MVDYLNIAYFPTVCLRHILEWIKDYKTIAEIDAVRGFGIETKREKSAVFPFIRERRTTMREIRLTFRGRDKSGLKVGGYGTFPVKEVFRELERMQTEDLVVNRITLMNKNEELWEIFKHSVKIKRPIEKWERFMMVTLKNVNQKRAPLNLKNQILDVMGREVERLRFKIGTLDLVRLENYPDWKVNMSKNLIPPINQDTSILKLALDPLFKEGYRHIRTYVRKSKSTWEFLQSMRF